MRFISLFSRLYYRSFRSLSVPLFFKKNLNSATKKSSLGVLFLGSSGTFAYNSNKVDWYPFSISEQIKETLSMFNELSDMAYRRVKRDLKTPEGSLLLALVGMNAVVYLAWKIPSFVPFLSRHFTCSLSTVKGGRVHTLLTCNFSHAGFFHLFSNMFLLMHFGSDVCRIITPERFFVLYLAGGLSSSLTSLLSKYLLRGDALSLGASGSVMAIMFMYAMLFPNRDIYFFGYPLKAKDACVIWALLDATGLLGNFGRIDFAAHLGGAAFGLAYYEYKKRDIAKDYQQRKTTRLWYTNDIHGLELETRKRPRTSVDRESSNIWSQVRSTFHRWFRMSQNRRDDSDN
ncbi:Rhomboid protein 1, mitochondrial [Galdieria sulphuraria]|uniref:Rhomboid-like protein isoform 1 n=1 Tax=Galdieria sulphuraria TaxID=130081 RepID=M2Y467_GALSU|nr:rhomboid-like protein isoform 1 [Galdieria sulphuraria]EME30624.1 rhomboid-like protein isoform 1 [Galdieria sulphuraria]GJD09021.1 Rhomboid protein 1, mitochondrial [Galdieria sulphuraria]|eukprot:XP_005707144.1 rhomboid-like protein isoform 1 [Galdieria sulphuraria]